MMNSRKSFSESLPQSDQQKIRRIFSLPGNGEIAGMTWIYSCRAFSLEILPVKPGTGDLFSSAARCLIFQKTSGKHCTHEHWPHHYLLYYLLTLSRGSFFCSISEMKLLSPP